MKFKKKREKKRKIPQNCKSPAQRQRFMPTIKNVTGEGKKRERETSSKA